MRYIIKDADGKKMIMTVVSSIPSLPEGFEVLGLADDMPEVMAEIAAADDAERIKVEARQFLNETDKWVTRHRDQLELGIPTKLSEEEFSKLLKDRQVARDSI